MAQVTGLGLPQDENQLHRIAYFYGGHVSRLIYFQPPFWCQL